MSAFELDRSQWRSFLELLGKDIRKVRLRSFFPKGHPLKERDRGKKSNANGDWIKTGHTFERELIPSGTFLAYSVIDGDKRVLLTDANEETLKRVPF